jgi:hypothetical protein
MRPLVTLNHAVGVVMLLYAIGVLATPEGGAMGYIEENTPFTAPMVALLFAGCGLVIFFFNPNPAVFAVLTAPLLLYSLASLGYFIGPRGGSLTGFFAHISVWLVANAAITETARKWAN